MLPLPLYLATCGYGNNGRVRVTLPFPSRCSAISLSGGVPSSTQRRIAVHLADRGGTRAAEPVIDARREKQASKPRDLFAATHPL